MKTIELRHDPFLETTMLTIDGKEAHLNCIGTGEGHRLQEWKDEFFPQVIKKINIGPGSACAVVFFGIQEDFDNLKAVHDEFSKQHDDIKVILDYGTKPPVSLAGKKDTLKRLIDTACTDPFGGAEVKDRCNAILNKEFPSYVDYVGKLKEQTTEFNSLITEQNLPDKAEKHFAAKKDELNMVIANNEAKRLEAECSVGNLDELEQSILKAEQELLRRGYDETITPANIIGSIVFAPVRISGTMLKNMLAEGTAVTKGQPICIIKDKYNEVEVEVRATINGFVHYLTVPGSELTKLQAVAEIKIPVQDIHAIEELKTALIRRYCSEIETLFSDSALEGFHAALPSDSTEINKQFTIEEVPEADKTIIAGSIGNATSNINFQQTDKEVPKLDFIEIVKANVANLSEEELRRMKGMFSPSLDPETMSLIMIENVADQYPELVSKAFDIPLPEDRKISKTGKFLAAIRIAQSRGAFNFTQPPPPIEKSNGTSAGTALKTTGAFLLGGPILGSILAAGIVKKAAEDTSVKPTDDPPVEPIPPREACVIDAQELFINITSYFEGELVKVNESLKLFIAEKKAKQQELEKLPVGALEAEKEKLENEVAALEGDIARVNNFIAEVNTVLDI